MQGYCKILWDSLQDLTLWMLLAAALVTIILWMTVENFDPDSTGWIEGVSIFLTVALVSNVAASQDYAKERQFRRLNADCSNVQVDVLRDGKNVHISRYDLVVGDVIRLSIGDILEADGLLVEAFDVAADESALQEAIDRPNIDWQDKIHRGILRGL